LLGKVKRNIFTGGKNNYSVNILYLLPALYIGALNGVSRFILRLSSKTISMALLTPLTELFALIPVSIFWVVFLRLDVWIRFSVI
jgi:hypothetical protein